MARATPLVAFCLILASSPTWADPATLIKDTLADGGYIYTSPLRLTSSDIPAALAVAATLGGSVSLDRITRKNLAPYQNTGSATDLKRYGDIAQFSGPILFGLFGSVGLMEDDSYKKEVAWNLLESFAWANAVSETFKITLGRQRPYITENPFVFKPGKTNGSFPSGHTISAFAAATTLSEYYPTWEVEVPAYAAATAVGFSRLYANQHWGSDVVAGALMGYGVSHALYKHHHPSPQSSWDWQLSPAGITLTRKF